MLQIVHMPAGKSQHHICQHNTCGESGKGGNHGAGEGIAGFSDMRGHKVDAHGIENRLGAAHGNRGDESDAGICPIFFESVQQKPGSCGGGKHFYDGQRLSSP